MKLGQYDQAEAAYTAALKINSDDNVARNGIAAAFPERLSRVFALEKNTNGLTYGCLLARDAWHQLRQGGRSRTVLICERFGWK